MTKSSTVDLVTKTDERVEKIIIGSLKKEFSSHWWVVHDTPRSLSDRVEARHITAQSCFEIPLWFIDSSVLQFHWGGVGCKGGGVRVDWQTYMDHRPSGRHHKLCTWVRCLCSWSTVWYVVLMDANTSPKKSYNLSWFLAPRGPVFISVCIL